MAKEVVKTADVVPPIEAAQLAIQEINTAIRVELDRQNSGEAQLLMIGRIMAAPDAESANVGGAATHAREILNTPIEIHRISWNESDYPEGFFDVYPVFHGVEVRTGIEVVVTCGGNTVVPWAYRAVRDGWLPQTVVFTETKPDKETGFKAINLTVVPGAFPS